MVDDTFPKKQKQRITREQIRSYLLSYNASGSELDRLDTSVNEQNHHTLRIVAPICAALLLFMTLFAFFARDLGSSWSVYLVKRKLNKWTHIHFYGILFP